MASGTLLAAFDAQANQPFGASVATPDVRNYLLVLDFDAVTNEVAGFAGRLPPTYGGGGLTFKIRWMASTAVSGSVQWLIQLERHQRGVDDTDVNSFVSSASVTTAAVTPAGTEMETIITLAAGAAMDNLQAGERFRMLVTRIATSDDMAGDAELVQLDIYET